MCLFVVDVRPLRMADCCLMWVCCWWLLLLMLLMALLRVACGPLINVDVAVVIVVAVRCASWPCVCGCALLLSAVVGGAAYAGAVCCVLCDVAVDVAARCMM